MQMCTFEQQVKKSTLAPCNMTITGRSACEVKVV